jgi:hypothetical protein
VITEAERTALAPYCPRCGRSESAGGHERCAARELTDPPRFCAACGRKLAVQVTPTGYTATCVRCG